MKGTENEEDEMRTDTRVEERMHSPDASSSPNSKCLRTESAQKYLDQKKGLTFVLEEETVQSYYQQFTWIEPSDDVTQ